ncbi:MAG: serine/threonine-protein kinase [bacterium]
MSDIHLTGFELIEKIGEGGMGHVWKARQLSLDRIVAIKLLPSRYSRDPESVRQIVQEARTAAKLKHPGIVQVYDASEDCGNYYFVMEFVDGYNVGQWIKRKVVLPVYDALVVVESVVAALDYAWRTAGLIHCDIKPENIMVDQDGTIKVADLGLSLTRDSDLSTPSDEVAGTPGYISPEQVQGIGKLDCRTDIYALGCCLYQMVTGKRPFTELSAHEAMEAQVTSQIPDPRDRVAGIPAHVCCLIERMLVKDPEKRLKDWQTVLSDLHRVQKGLMPAGPHPLAGESTMLRRRAPKGGASDLNTGKTETPGRRGFSWMTLILLVLAGVAAAGFLYLRKHEADLKKANQFIPDIPVIPVIPVHSETPVLENDKSTVGGSLSTPQHKTLRKAKRDQASLVQELNEMKRAVNDYVENGAFEEGIRWLENYSGKWVLETTTNRMAFVSELRNKMSERQDEKEWNALTKEVSALILSGKYTAARLRVEPVIKEGKCQKHVDELTDIARILAGVGSLSDKILDTFAGDVGKVITINLSRGKFMGKVIEIRDRKVVCKTPDGMAQVNIQLEDLSKDERMTRLSRLETPEVCLALGVANYNDKQTDAALKYLNKTGSVLGPLLTCAVSESVSKQTQEELLSDPACMAFLKLVEQARIQAYPVDVLRWRKDIDGRRMGSDVAGSVDRGLEAFLVSHGQSSFVERNPELIMALQKACGISLE